MSQLIRITQCVCWSAALSRKALVGEEESDESAADDRVEQAQDLPATMDAGDLAMQREAVSYVMLCC
jgi:hypothetical protein